MNELLKANEDLYKKVQKYSDQKRALRKALLDLKHPTGCYCSLNTNVGSYEPHKEFCKNAVRALEMSK